MDALREAALEAAAGKAPVPSEIERVAAATSPDAARWAFTQWDLRSRGSAKFARSQEMLFVREALEQATHEAVAAYHASRFPAGERVADLTCGLGADLIALAARGPALGFDTDPERAACARHNLAAHGRSAEVREEDCLSAEWAWNYALADPSRRPGGRRTLDPKAFAPDPVTLAARLGELRLGLLKLSPMLEDDFLRSLGAGLEFVSYGGECREALVWTGTEAEAGRWAVHVESGSRLLSGDAPWPVEEPGEYLYEADPAAIRAHTLGALCEAHAFDALGDSNGYLTGATLVDSPWLKAYRVLGSGAWDLKVLRRELAALGSNTPIVKVRACSVNPERTVRTLKADGARGLIVAAYPVGLKIRFAILERL